MQNIKQIINKAVPALMLGIVIPAIGLAQPGALPSGPEVGGGEDQNPDAVPFDGNMNLVFLGIGVLFAVLIIWQEIRKRRKLQGSNVK
ncbi:MAG: hypothetical protein QM791_04715 [Ferruginibacter sp.]